MDSLYRHLWWQLQYSLVLYFALRNHTSQGWQCVLPQFIIELRFTNHVSGTYPFVLHVPIKYRKRSLFDWLHFSPNSYLPLPYVICSNSQQSMCRFVYLCFFACCLNADAAAVIDVHFPWVGPFTDYTRYCLNHVRIYNASRLPSVFSNPVIKSPVPFILFLSRVVPIAEQIPQWLFSLSFYPIIQP